MQIFDRDLTKTHEVGSEWPSFLRSVQLGESFVIETMNHECDPNGPIEIIGVNAGDNIAIFVEKIEIEGPFFAPNGGPFFEGIGEQVSLEFKDGYFYWPSNFRLKATPSIGNIAILPSKTEENLHIARTIIAGPLKGKKNPKGWWTFVRAPRDKHCHQDCWALTEGSILHMKAQVNGAGICMDDVHAYIGQGEVAFDGIGVYAKVQLRVERSNDWFIDWPLIETEDEIMVCCSYTSTYPNRKKESYVDVVRKGYGALRKVIAHKINSSIIEANSIVATATDIKNCAIYGLGDYIQKNEKTGQPDYDIAIVASLPKDIFINKF